MTLTAEVTPDPLPSATETPVVTQAAQNTTTPVDLPVPTISSTTPSTAAPTPPCNRASAGRPSIDVTIPDGSLFKAGDSFSKTWRLVNTGSCTWTRHYTLVWFSGEMFGSTTSEFIPTEVHAGDIIDLTVDMVAPQDPGVHQSNWKLRTESGELFGLGPAGDAPFWARVEVEKEDEPPAPAPELTLTPTSIVVVKGTAVISKETSLDLDSGKTNLGNVDDLALLMQGEESVLVMPINGARISLFGTQSPTEEDCSLSTLSDGGTPLNAIPENTFICYRTNQALLGTGEVTKIEGESFTLVFTTWMIP